MSEQVRFSDANDSPHTLPLRIIPLQTQALKDARLTKNERLESVVELFADQQTGSGQVYPRQLNEFFDFSGDRRKDYEVMQALGELPSYDVYSLRSALSELSIDVDDSRGLHLSKEMESRLSGYLRSFTRPLIFAIYGEERANGQGISDIAGLLLDPDVEAARNNLRALAAKLEISLLAVPEFLAEYGDVYLSLAYYNYCLDQIRPALVELKEALTEIRRNPSNRADRELMKACVVIDDRLIGAEVSTSRILEIFRTQTEDMWRNVSLPRVQAMEASIYAYQKEIGGSICALTVKMNSWEVFMRNPRSGTSESFIRSDLLMGIERVPQGYLSAANITLRPSS